MNPGLKLELPTWRYFFLSYNLDTVNHNLFGMQFCEFWQMPTVTWEAQSRYGIFLPPPSPAPGNYGSGLFPAPNGLPLHINWIILFAVFWGCIFPGSTRHLRFFRVVEYIKNSFFLVLMNIPSICLLIAQFRDTGFVSSLGWFLDETSIPVFIDLIFVWTKVSIFTLLSF